MYTIVRVGQQIDSSDRVNFAPLTQGGNLNAARFIFRGYTFFLNLLPRRFSADRVSDLLYRDVTHKWNVNGRLSHVVSINGWKQEPKPAEPAT